MTTVRFQRLTEKAVLPSYAKPGDAGLDLVATSMRYDIEGDYIEYGTGLSVEIPAGFEGQVRMRSSVSDLLIILCNGVGTVDSNYRGEIKARFRMIPDASETMTELMDQQDEVCYTFTHYAYQQALEAMNINLAPAYCYATGDRVVQLVIASVPQIEVVEAQTLTETARGEGGFGSTGS